MAVAKSTRTAAEEATEKPLYKHKTKEKTVNKKEGQQLHDMLSSLLERNFTEEELAAPVEPNIDHIAASLLQLKAVETLPLLQKCYQTLRIPEIEVEGGYNMLKIPQNGQEKGRKKFGVTDYLRNFAA